MLHEAQRTSAPSAFSVSISTAVWMVMCREPAMRAPLQRLLRAVLLAHRHQAGHLGLGDGDFLAAPVGEADILDDVVGDAASGGLLRRGHGGSWLRWEWRRAPVQAGSAACAIAGPTPAGNEDIKNSLCLLPTNLVAEPSAAAPAASGHRRGTAAWSDLMTTAPTSHSRSLAAALPKPRRLPALPALQERRPRRCRARAARRG